MSNLLYFDCFSGISGDMILGACLDLGVELTELQSEISGLELDNVRLEARRVKKNGIAACKVDVIYGYEQRKHRHLPEIVAIIEGSKLSPAVKEVSVNIFKNLAAAEAVIHDITPQKVHFHEVGSLDAIVDVVGAAVCFEKLGITDYCASALNVGSGFVQCEHGTMPVPAPATLELLKGVPVYTYVTDRELVTPTGAAILRTVCKDFGTMPSMVPEKVGYGSGERDNVIPNVLRLVLGNQYTRR